MDSETTEPAVNGTLIGVRKGRHSSKPVVAVQDSDTEWIALQDDRAGHSACTCYVVPGTEKLCLSIRDVCDACMESNASIVLDKHGYDLLRAWVKDNSRKRNFVPFPRELADRLDALQIEHLKPPSSFSAISE